MRCALALLGMLAAFPQTALSQDDVAPPPYLDDRSTGETTIRSLYNAIDRGELLRAWSYFERDYTGLDEAAIAQAYAEFAQGYAETVSVEIALGAETAEGAAGSTYFTVPMALAATNTDGAVQTFAGCYVLRLAEPSIQDTPPFRPLAIELGTLDAVEGTPDQSVPETCPAP